jgi:uncharacterized protein (TIGR02266 family)
MVSFQDREPRYRVEIRVDCTTKDLFLANRMTNISRGGFFIEATLPLHAEVDLCFRLPNSPVAIDAKGCVIWNYDMKKDSAQLVAGSGIKFTEMSEVDRHNLEQYLAGLSAGRTPGAGPSPMRRAAAL